MLCVLCIGSIPQEIPFLILSALLCAGQASGEDRTAKKGAQFSPFPPQVENLRSQSRVAFL